MAFCVNCGRELPPGAGFCPKCGARAEAAVCPKCGREVDPDDAFCPSCGAPLAPAPEPEPTPEPEPAFQRVARIPGTCPRCGKPSLPGYDHCTYCGQEWEVLKVPEVCPVCGEPSEAGSDRCTNCGEPWPRGEGPKPEDGDPNQTQTFGTGEPPREFSWRYRRATMRWSERVSIRAEVDDKRLLCAFKRRMLWHEGETEQEIPLKQISSFTMTSKVSVAVWALTMTMLFIIAAPPLLPLLGVDAFVDTKEVAVGVVASLMVCALMMWWVRFHLRHYHLTIRGQTGIAELELDAQGYDDLWRLQTELTRRTGIQPTAPGENGVTGKVIAGVLIGALLAAGLVALVVSQLPETSSAETLADASAASSTTEATATPSDDEEEEYVSGSNEELRVLYGNWKAVGHDQVLTIENDLSTGQVNVTHDYYSGGARILGRSGILSADDDGNLYADLMSAPVGGLTQQDLTERIYLLYDDNSIYAFWIYGYGTRSDVLQFERQWW